MDESDIDLNDFLSNGDSIPQNPNEFLLKGTPVETKPIFTKSPLPEDLLFEGYENFLHFLPCFGYYDENFCNDVLTRNYNKSLKIIEKQIIICKENIDKCTQELNEIENKNLVPEKSKLSYLNSKYWRESVILYWSEIKYKKKLNEKKIKAYQQNLYIFRRLISIVQELRSHIRYIAILYSNIESITKNLANGFKSKLCYKIKAVNLALSDKQYCLGLLPQPFLDLEKAKDQIIQIIKSCQRYIDPTTNYLCESNLTLMFEDFMKSDFSPLKILESKYDIVNQFDQIVNSTIKAIQAFSKINDPQSTEIIGLLASRFWFSRTLICKFDMIKSNIIFQKKLIQLRSKKIIEMDPPKSCFDVFNLNYTSIEFFNTNTFLIESIELFNSILFFYAPEDIMKQFHLINLTFAGYMATKLKVDINAKVVPDGIKFLWKLLFIVSSTPNIDCIIRFVHKYMNFSCYPKKLTESFNIPLDVCKSF